MNPLFANENYGEPDSAGGDIIEAFAELNEHDAELDRLGATCNAGLDSAAGLIGANEVILDQEIAHAVNLAAVPVLEHYFSLLNNSLARLGIDGFSQNGYTQEKHGSVVIAFTSENLVEKAKELYYRAIVFMKKMAQRFMLYVTGLLYSSKRVTALAERVKKLAIEREDEKDFSDKKVSLSKREIRWLVRRDGKTVDAVNFARDYRKINETENEVGSLVNFIIEQFESHEFEVMVGDQKLITGRTTEFKNTFKARFAALAKIKSVEYPFGSAKLEIMVKPETMHCAIAIVKSPFEPKELSVPVMSPADAKTVAETAIHALEKYKDDKPVIAIEKSMKEFIRALDKFVQNNNAYGNGELAKIVTGLQGIGLLGISAYRANRNYMLQLHHNALIYAEQSLLKIRAKKN